MAAAAKRDEVIHSLFAQPLVFCVMNVKGFVCGSAVLASIIIFLETRPPLFVPFL
jgi:hypothetical protein